MGSDTRTPSPARFEWTFPLRGRWRICWFRAAANVLALCAVLFGIAAAEVVSHLISAQNLRVERNTHWRIGETQGNYDRTGTQFSLALGSLRLDYRYPARGLRHSWEPWLGLVLQVLVIATPFVLAWRFLRLGFQRWAWSFGGVLAVLLFPVAIACGPMGCSNIQTWHCILQWISGSG